MNAYITEKLVGTAAESTLKKRISFLNGLSESIPGFNDFSFLNNTGLVIDRINKSSNVDTQWNWLWHVIMAIRSDPKVISEDAIKIYDELAESLKTIRDAKRTNNVKNEKQAITLKSDLTMRTEELRGMVAKLFSDHDLPYKVPTAATLQKMNVLSFAKALQDLIIPAVYLFQPALRNDWGDLNITTRMTGLSNDKNYLYVRGKTMRLIMSVYKNSKSLGKQVIAVRDELSELLKIWLQILKFLLGMPPSYCLIYNITKTKCEHVESEDALRRQIPRATQRVFDLKDDSGKSIGLSINDFRHLWESHIQRDPAYARMTLDERRKIHLELLHGTEIAQQYNLQD